MAQFMAKNLLPNCPQGKATANRLWEQLSKQLNAVGPPTKLPKLWKKVYADQKYNAKRKLSFNKASKRRTGGGPYQEKGLTPAEELLIEAAGLEACVEGINSVPTFGDVRTPSPAAPSIHSEDESSSSQLDLPSTSAACYTPARKLTPRATPKVKRSQDAKTALLEGNLKATAEHQRTMCGKFDEHLEIQKRQLEISERQLQLNERQLEINEGKLQMKEAEHQSQMSTRQVDYQIKCLELEVLGSKSKP